MGAGTVVDLGTGIADLADAIVQAARIIGLAYVLSAVVTGMAAIVVELIRRNGNGRDNGPCG
jgi:hypothetical protein